MCVKLIIIRFILFFNFILHDFKLDWYPWKTQTFIHLEVESNDLFSFYQNVYY